MSASIMAGRLRTLVISLCLTAALQGAAPAWLEQAAALAIPPQSAAVPAIILVNDATLEVDDRGMVTETRRYAVRILTSVGRKHATGLVAYNGASARLVEAEAWVLREGKTMETRRKAEWVDIAANAPGAAIDETRVASFDVSERSVQGDVVGWEARVRTPLVVAQLYWSFGDRLPQLAERLTVVLPPGFSLRHHAYGPTPPGLAEGTDRWTWTLADQPYRPDETAAPELAQISAELLVQILPPAQASNFAVRNFASWEEVTQLYEQLNAGQCDSSPALAAKTQELVAGEASPLGRIRRIAEQVQRVRYIGIYRGLRYGYGWKARKASEVFATGYGDCKDKANLMIAMLREAGLKSHRVIAQLDRDRLVRPEFPSPIQFNHAILAIEVPDTVDLPAVQTVAGVGRLLFFDPTNPYTQVGDLSLSLQGGFVQLAVPGVAGLVQLPQWPAEAGFQLERQLELAVAADGALALRGHIIGHRQVAAQMRQRAEEATMPADQKKWAIQQLASGLKTAVVSEVFTQDDRGADVFTLNLAGHQPGYLQRTSIGAVLKLDVLGKQHLPNLSGQQRNLPVDLTPLAVQDQIEVTLPGGFVVEEVPRDAEVKSDYGRFSVAFTQEAGRLILRRQLVLERRVVPVAEVARLRQFLGDIARADRTALLLKPKT